MPTSDKRILSEPLSVADAIDSPLYNFFSVCKTAATWPIRHDTSFSSTNYSLFGRCVRFAGGVCMYGFLDSPCARRNLLLCLHASLRTALRAHCALRRQRQQRCAALHTASSANNTIPCFLTHVWAERDLAGFLAGRGRHATGWVRAARILPQGRRCVAAMAAAPARRFTRAFPTHRLSGGERRDEHAPLSLLSLFLVGRTLYHHSPLLSEHLPYCAARAAWHSS